MALAAPFAGLLANLFLLDATDYPLALEQLTGADEPEKLKSKSLMLPRMAKAAGSPELRKAFEDRDIIPGGNSADEFGRFRFATSPGPIRLRLVGVVVTPWITR